MQPALDRGDGIARHLGDLFVTEPFHVLEQEDLAVALGQAVGRFLDRMAELGVEPVGNTPAEAAKLALASGNSGRVASNRLF